MTLWEFDSCVAGYNDAHKSSDAPPPPMGDDELAAMGIEGF
jgi:hypothetical protein